MAMPRGSPFFSEACVRFRLDLRCISNVFERTWVWLVALIACRLTKRFLGSAVLGLGVVSRLSSQ